MTDPGIESGPARPTDIVIDARYRLIERVGSGGMAEVWCAEDQQLGRRVALKLLHRQFSEDPEFVERFKREASAAASLQHPHVVSVYDRGEWDGTYYIAMEFLEGRSLKQVVREEAPLDLLRAIDLTVQILRAARFAHQRGIVHRDIKSHNVIVDDEGRAKVTDFGIARAGASDMTETGSIMGTAQYLSPEQAQGHAVSPQSDLYAIGIVLYELLTGRVPFDGESAVTIALKQVAETPVPPSSYNLAVPPELDAVVLRAMAKDPAERYQSAGDLGRAALAAVEGRQPDAPERIVAVGQAAPAEATPAPTVATPPQRPAEPATTPARTAPQPPQQPMPAPPPPPVPDAQRPTPPKRRGGLIALAVVAGVVLVLGIAAGVLVATGAFSSSSSGEDDTAVTGGGLGPPSTRANDTTTTTATSGGAITGSDVRAVLDRYAAAYTAHDTAGLKALFAPTFTRTTDDQAARGLGASLAEYRKQFHQFPDSVYHLDDVSVKPGADEASASALYEIDNAGAAPSKGSIGFHLSRVGDELKIDAIALRTG